MKKTVLCITNNDSRQKYLARMMEQQGEKVITFESVEKVECISDFDILLLPVLSGKINLERVAKEVCQGQKVFGGMFPASFLESCRNQGAICIDYMKQESVAIRNTVATAEGALAEAIILGDTNLADSSCLVLGYGRCGQILAERLASLHASVTVYERGEKRQALAWAHGFRVIENVEDAVQHKYDYLFNTVPAQLINSAMLSCLNKEIVIIDIASGKGGVDMEYCVDHGIRAKLCPGLPGKYAPKSSAEILFMCVRRNL